MSGYDTVDRQTGWNGLNKLVQLRLIQVSLSNSPFSLKTACFENVPILDPILPRSTHDGFTWIGNFNPVFFVE